MRQTRRDETGPDKTGPDPTRQDKLFYLRAKNETNAT